MPSAIGRSSVPLAGRVRERMGRTVLSGVFLLGMTLPAVNSALPAAAQESTVSFSTAEAAPADSLSYTVATLDDTSAQWTQADALIDRAGFGEALDEALAEELSDEAGEDVPLDAFLGGEVAVVVSQVAIDTMMEESMGGADLDAMMGEMGMATPEAAPAEPDAQGFAVILDARAPDTAWAGIVKSADEDGSTESTYEGTTILYSPPSDDDDEGTAAARVGDLIVFGTAPTDLHPIIDTADGRTPNITTIPEFTSARDALPVEFLMFSFSNNISDMDLAALGPMGPALEGLVPDAFSATTVAADEPGFRMEAVTLPAEGETLPAGAENFTSDLVDIAPEDALAFFSAADLGEAGVLDALGAALLGLAFGMGDPSMAPAGTPDPDMTPEEAIAQQYEDVAGLLGVNLQTDLFQQFTGEYGGWLSADPASQQASGLFVSNVDDAETVSNALMQLSFLIQGASGAESPLTTREVDGGQVYVIEPDGEAGSTVEFGIVGDRFVIGSGDAVERLAGDASDGLSGNAQFTEVMATLPAEGNGTFYLDLAQAIPLMEAASEEADEFAELGGMGQITDASETCANYETQAEAQAAYDAGDPDTFDLDQDFDGEACEDFFTKVSGDDATPVADEAGDDVEEALTDVDYSAVKAFASVSYEEDGLTRSSSILYIAE